MQNVYDMDSGLFYCALTSQRSEEAEPEKHKSTVGEGLAIIGSFFTCALAIIIAI